MTSDIYTDYSICIINLILNKMNKNIARLFNDYCEFKGVNNFNLNHDYNKPSLKMDFNSVYGGYRIDTIKGDGSTGVGFYYKSTRMNCKEMTAYLEGLLLHYYIYNK